MHRSIPFEPDALYRGDCLDVVRGWPEGSVDLIYLDPPFNSRARYGQIFGAGNGAEAQATAFRDTWTWDEAAAARVAQMQGTPGHPARRLIEGLRTILGSSGMLAYLSYMAERLAAMKPLLRESGSIWLHCDPTASHYLKILMDGIFGPENFRNEIVWCYTGPSSTRKWFPRKHDVLLFYSRNHHAQGALNLDDVRIPYKQLNHQHGAGSGKGGGIGGRLDEGNVDSYRSKGKVPEDYWLEDRDGMTPVGRLKRERLGYPTQKPRALLERIVRACTGKGDLVLDPFSGCGTTVHAAQRLERRWIGIDISPISVRMMQRRLQRAQVGIPVPVHGIPTDLRGARDLRDHDQAAFGAWVVTAIPGMAPNEARAGEGGVDGRGAVLDGSQPSRLVIAQVRDDGYSASALRDFKDVLDRENALAGVFVTLRKTDAEAALAEAAKLGRVEVGSASYPRLQLWSVEEMLADKRPDLPALADPHTGRQIQEDLPAVGAPRTGAVLG